MCMVGVFRAIAVEYRMAIAAEETYRRLRSCGAVRTLLDPVCAATNKPASSSPSSTVTRNDDVIQ